MDGDEAAVDAEHCHHRGYRPCYIPHHDCGDDRAGQGGSLFAREQSRPHAPRHMGLDQECRWESGLVEQRPVELSECQGIVQGCRRGRGCDHILSQYRHGSRCISRQTARWGGSPSNRRCVLAHIRLQGYFRKAL